MRMRKKRNLEPRLEKAASALLQDPQSLKGHWRTVFPGYRELAVELGCGKGRFTADTAAAEPELFLAAVERVPEATVVGMERVTRRGLQNVRFLDMDAAELCRVFAPGEADRIYVNFCDPWPSNGHAKRRLTAPDYLTLYRTVLRPGGELRFKTDNVPLFDWSVEQLRRCGWEILFETHDLHHDGIADIMTDYEAKFHSQGVPICKCVARTHMEPGLPVEIRETRPTPILVLPDAASVPAGIEAMAVRRIEKREDGVLLPEEAEGVFAAEADGLSAETAEALLQSGAERGVLPGGRYALLPLNGRAPEDCWTDMLRELTQRGYGVDEPKPVLIRGDEIAIPVKSPV